MPHTCSNCEETFETLSGLRLHDCPGPDPNDAGFGAALVDATERGLERGDVVPLLPDRPILPKVIEQWENSAGIIATIPVPISSPNRPETERFGLATVAGAYVIEYFPREGWIVVRTSSGAHMSEDEIHEELEGLVSEWQATVSDLVLEHAPDKDAHLEALEREIGWRP